MNAAVASIIIQLQQHRQQLLNVQLFIYLLLSLRTDVAVYLFQELGKTDHNKVYYRPFRKEFYVEVPEIARMTDEGNWCVYTMRTRTDASVCVPTICVRRSRSHFPAHHNHYQFPTMKFLVTAYIWCIDVLCLISSNSAITFHNLPITSGQKQ